MSLEDEVAARVWKSITSKAISGSRDIAEAIIFAATELGLGDKNLDNLTDGITHKRMLATEQTKLSGIEVGATADQTGLEMQEGILNLPDNEQVLVPSEIVGTSGKIVNIYNDGADLIVVSME